MPGEVTPETKRWLSSIDASIVQKQINTSTLQWKKDDEEAFRVVSETIIQQRMGYKPEKKRMDHLKGGAFIRCFWFIKKRRGTMPSVICLIFISSSCEGPKFGTKDARTLVQSKSFSAFKSFKRTAIVVFPDAKRMTPSAKKIIYTSFNSRVLHFQIYDLLFDPTEHFLFPQSRRLSQVEISQLCKKMGIKDSPVCRENKLPHLKATDPMCKFMGYEPMDVIQIDRGTHLYWRVVLDYV